MNPPTTRPYRSPLKQHRFPLAAAALALTATLLLALLSPFTNPSNTSSFGTTEYQPQTAARPIIAAFILDRSRTATSLTTQFISIDFEGFRTPDQDDLKPTELPHWSRARHAIVNRKPLPPGTASRDTREHAHGWPFRALAATLISERHLNPTGPAVRRHPLTIPFRSTFTSNTNNTPLARQTLIPLRPLWTGLAANTALLTPPIYALLVLPRLLRDHRRARNHRCRRCNYDIANLNACPECSTPTPR